MIRIQRNGATPSMPGSPETFTGQVRIDGLFEGPEAGVLSGATVTFEPGARTAWHQHPKGQTLLVLAGEGFVQQEGEVLQAISPGDVVVIPANTRHWHGASASNFMSHIALQESDGGEVVEWFEHVSAVQYPG